MELPLLDNVCGILSLKTGCIVLGLVNSLVTFFLGLILTAKAKGITDQERRRGRPVDPDPASDVAFAIIVFMATLFFLKFLADTLFVWAVYTRRLGIIKKYFIFWILFVVLFIIGYVKIMFQMRTETAMGFLMFLASNLLYICVVRSHMIKFDEDEDRSMVVEVSIVKPMPTMEDSMQCPSKARGSSIGS